ncbi:MAG: Asp23/Gls24 family envelope stress response protein [Butyrivibrio sp.]
MKGHLDNQYGEVLIDNDVIAKYAGATAVECFGIVGMASVNIKDGFVKLLKKESLTRGISVSYDDKNKIVIDFHVIVAYGVSISTVADNLVHNVKYKVEEFTGMKVGRINVYVEGVRIID